MRFTTLSNENRWKYRFFFIFLLAVFIPTTLVTLFGLNIATSVLREEAEKSLSVINDSTQQQLIRWTDNNEKDLEFFANSQPEFVGTVKLITSQAPQTKSLKDNIRNNEFKNFLKHTISFFEVFLLDAQTGEVILSSDISQEGKLKTDRPYFEQGRSTTHTQNVYFSLTLQEQATTIATPLRDSNGNLVAVIAGRVSLNTINEVLEQPKELGESAQSYAVNDFKFIVSNIKNSDSTNPSSSKFRPLNTFPVLESLKGNRGVSTYTTYNGTEVIGSYQYIDNLDLVVITEIDASEILAPTQTLRTLVLLSALVTITITILIAFSITRVLINSTSNYRQQLLRKNKELTQAKEKVEEQNVTLVHNTLSLTEFRNELEDKNAELSNALSKAQELSIILENDKQQRELLLQSLTDGVFAVDHKNLILFFNKAAESITGLQSSEVIGKNVDDVFKLYRKGKQIGIERYSDISPEVQQELRDVGLQYRQNNEEVTLSLSSAEVAFETPSSAKLIVTFQNKSKERELEEMKLDFVSMAAHELRTPLTAIVGYLSVFLNTNRETLDSDQNMLLGRAKIASEQLSALVENLLNVSKIERDSLTLDIKPTNWLEIVDQSVNDLTHRAKDKNIQLIFTPPETNLPAVLADRLRIREVLDNLISNAISYTQSEGHIEVSVKVENNNVITSVRDSGIGIPKSALPHLFTKFFRVSGSLEQGSKGTGLGLYISKSIIELHHGEIWAESVLHKGSTFYFSLPATDE